MKLKQAIKNLGTAQSIATAMRVAEENNIRWNDGVSFVFHVIANDLERVPGNIGGNRDDENSVIKNGF
ncbi:MAG: hypothetical protein KBT88_15285 [Gammaproteobacteria bacterium]|nr:hypothetical protein [Gammaproteobacteria bacterium]MBQ0841143.1 hypothetical protein [Gammaproteobacteria bacterium]